MSLQEHQCPRIEERVEWIYTYGDMVTLLLAFFILLFALAKTEEEKFKAVSESFRGGPPASPYIFSGLPTFMDNLLQRIRASSIGDDVTVNVDDKGITVSFNDTALFEPGSAEPKKGADVIIEKFAKILYAVPNSVVVEGHTDNIPIHTTQYPSNWELSAARAATVTRMLEKKGLRSNRMEIAAYGPTRPKFPNNTPKTRALNRRIDILIKPEGL